MSGLTEQEREALLCTCDMKGGKHSAHWCNFTEGVTTMMQNERLIATVAQIKARAVAETAERIAVAIERECPDYASFWGTKFARIARAKAGR